ncbi:MAG TPA: lysylphosphatidylglycerol synthase transmembrane domain-containing protein [Candidatus Acidoferrum sp.]|nr:lysylphosphatidylglycerol synthase transmembrane domain-containing protein [Candidatus Acidoferrum sp.]
MAKKLRLLFLLIGFGLFCYLVASFGLSNIVTNLKKTGWWFLPVVAIWGIGYICNTITWRLVLGTAAHGMGIGESFATTVGSFALNYTTPFLTLGGEPFRALAIKERVGMRRAVSSVLLFRMIHTTAQLIFWVIAVIIVMVWFPVSTRVELYLSIVLFVLILLIMLFFLAHRHGVMERLFRILLKFPVPQSWIIRLQKREEAIQAVDVLIKELYHERKGTLIQAIGTELLFRLVVSVEYYFILHAIGSDISLPDAVYVSAAVSLMLNIVFFIPFELGAREGSLYLIMQSLNLSSGVGVYVSLVNRIRELCWIAIGLLLIQISGGRARVKEAATIDTGGLLDNKRDI